MLKQSLICSIFNTIPKAYKHITKNGYHEIFVESFGFISCVTLEKLSAKELEDFMKSYSTRHH